MESVLLPLRPNCQIQGRWDVVKYVDDHHLQCLYAKKLRESLVRQAACAFAVSPFRGLDPDLRPHFLARILPRLHHHTSCTALPPSTPPLCRSSDSIDENPASRGIYTSSTQIAMAATMSAQQMSSVFPKSHVGFDSITNQIEKKLLKRGFQFNVICVGTSCASLSMLAHIHIPSMPARIHITCSPSLSSQCRR